MPLFFDVRPSEGPTKALVRDALARHGLSATELEIHAEQVTRQIQATGGVQPRTGSFVVAAVLLAVLAGLALWAESAYPKSSAQLWTAFQTVLGVIVGFLGGEASGIAAVK